MFIREYRESDLAQLRAIHAAQGFDYPLPDLNNPLFVTKLVLTNADNASSQSDAMNEGAIVGAALLRLTAEAYLLLDPRAGEPRQRWQSLLALHAAAERDAWLPPPIANKFGKRLTRLGWQRDDTWPPYCKKLATCVPQEGSRSEM
jgi:hypothetical protein